MLDSFVALTYHPSLTITEWPLSELGMLRCFNDYAMSLLKIISEKELQTQELAREYTILNVDYLMEFYGIEEIQYNPYLPSYLISNQSTFYLHFYYFLDLI